MSDNIRIVLVEPSHPGNIGAAARAMKTMSVNKLYLVNPRQFPDPQAIAMAAGADDLLAGAVVVSDLSAAIADCRLVVATSARSRTLPWPMLDPRICGETLVSAARQAAVAVVFGRERVGLTNDELQQCQYHVQIPANENYASLNLAAAVQILCYEIKQASLVASPQETRIDSLAKQIEIEGFYQQLSEVLRHVDFLKVETAHKLMARIRRLFARTQLEQKEVNILRGILTALAANFAENAQSKIDK